MFGVMVKKFVLSVISIEMGEHAVRKRGKVVATIVVVVLDNFLTLLYDYGLSLLFTFLASCFLPFFGIGRVSVCSFNLTVSTNTQVTVRRVTSCWAALGRASVSWL